VSYPDWLIIAVLTVTRAPRSPPAASPPRQGRGPLRVASTGSHPAPEGTGYSAARYPSCDLCNRPVVTSTHSPLESQAWCLRTADLRFTSRPVTRALARAGHDAIHIDAETPLPEISTPGDAAVGRRTHQLRHHAILPKGLVHARWSRDPHTLVRQRASRVTGSLTFPVALGLSTPKAWRSAQHQEPILSRRANATRLSARNAFHR